MAVRELTSKLIRKLIFNIYWYINKVAAVRYLGVKVGSNTRIYTKNFGSEPFLISIGNNCTITSECSFLTHNGALSLVKDSDKNRLYHFQPIEVGDNVFIGHRTIIMQGVKIETNVIVGAGSVVNKSVPKNSVVIGNPIKYVCSFEEYVSKIKSNEQILNNSQFFNSVDYKNKIYKMLDSSFKEYLKK